MYLRIDGQWAHSIGYVSDLTWITRYGEGACGMFEATWTMPLDPTYENSALRRGRLVEIMDGPVRVGSSLVLADPERGTGLGDPWKFTATGLGREVEGDNSYYAWDGSLNASAVPSTAIDQAITRGLQWAGRASSIPTTAVGASSTTDAPNTIGALLNRASSATSQRWGVGQDNYVTLISDPTTASWRVSPVLSGLAVADDDYASVVYARYQNSSGGAYATVASPTSTSAVETRYRRREFLVDLTPMGAISTATAQSYADGIYAKSKGRLGWASSLSLTRNELLTAGGGPADLAMVEAGQMVRIHGIFNDLLETTGQTWLDIIIGQTRYTDGAETVELSPLGLAPRDLAAIIESVTGYQAAA